MAIKNHDLLSYRYQSQMAVMLIEGEIMFCNKLKNNNNWVREYLIILFGCFGVDAVYNLGVITVPREITARAKWRLQRSNGSISWLR